MTGPLPTHRPARPPGRPTLAVWKFASCDGCQLSLLDCEDELLVLADVVHVACFPEATSTCLPGPYDVSLVEGSVTTAADVERVHEVRRVSRLLVTLGACATSGGIQALRNTVDVEELRAAAYPRPEYVATLDRSTPVSMHVRVDLELHGCPIDRHQLLEVLAAVLQGRQPRVTADPVCVECKRRGAVCVAVAHAVPCLGPVTRSGCGALCPRVGRGCYGCFGPTPSANVAALTAQLARLGVPRADVVRLLRTFTTGAEAFRAQSERLVQEVP